MIVIVGCGARKRLYPCRAVEMYRGQHFLACWAAAAALAEGNVYILSAKYGLLPPGKVIAPYDLTVGQPGAVTGDEVRGQARELGIARRPVVALCSARYVQLCREAWPAVDAPLAGLRIGQQRHVLAVIRRTGRLPAAGQRSDNPGTGTVRGGTPRVPPDGETLRFVRQVRTGAVHIAAWAPEEPWHTGWTEPAAGRDWDETIAEWVTSPGPPMLCGYRLKFGVPGLPGELAGGDGFEDEDLCVACVRALGDQQWRAFHVGNRGPFNEDG